MNSVKEECTTKEKWKGQSDVAEPFPTVPVAAVSVVAVVVVGAGLLVYFRKRSRGWNS
jgi:hypothetical protein